MVTERPPSLQDTFLNHVRDQETPLTVFLTNGVKLQGVIASFDNFSVMLVRDGFSQLIYKHAISTVMPLGPIKLLDDLAKTSQRSRSPTDVTTAALPRRYGTHCPSPSTG